jgi:tRNA_anti-like
MNRIIYSSVILMALLLSSCNTTASASQSTVTVTPSPVTVTVISTKVVTSTLIVTEIPISTSTQSVTTTPTSTAIAVAAQDLWAAYNNNNAVAADALYKGKTIQISGVESSVDEDTSGNPYILFAAPWPDNLMGVCCKFSSNNEAALAQLTTNQNVTIQGTCTGYNGMDVIIENCKLVQ